MWKGGGVEGRRCVEGRIIGMVTHLMKIFLSFGIAPLSSVWERAMIPSDEKGRADVSAAAAAAAAAVATATAAVADE